MAEAATQQKTQLPAIQVWREELAPLKHEFQPLLPTHISPDKFAQVCITAVEVEPKLLTADRHSLKIACMEAATDGLLPDKREGALVIFNTEVDVKREGSNANYKQRVALVKWMPMIRGLIKLAHQTGLVNSIQVELVHKNDQYRRAAGDNAEILHEPLDFGDRGDVVGGYAIVQMKDGGVYREVMSLEQIKAVQAVSKAQAGKSPWNTFWDEMARKTILRRCLKKTPMNAEVERAISRDDHLYTLEGSGAVAGLIPAASGVGRKAIFSDRARLPKKEPEPETVEAAADPAEAAEVETVDEALQKAVTAMNDAQDATALVEVCQEIEANPLLQNLTDDNKEWLSDTRAAALARLQPPFKPRAIISTEEGEKEYEVADDWKDAILNKMAALQGDVQAVFWKKNIAFVYEAGENGLDDMAEFILDHARGLGLPVDVELPDAVR